VSVRPILPASAAIDAGVYTDAPEWDQRGPGFPRIVNGTIDIGSFELQAPGAPKPPLAQRSFDPAILTTAELDQDSLWQRIETS
jgi:hypothetical protein